MLGFDIFLLLWILTLRYSASDAAELLLFFFLNVGRSAEICSEMDKRRRRSDRCSVEGGRERGLFCFLVSLVLYGF